MACSPRAISTRPPRGRSRPHGANGRFGPVVRGRMGILPYQPRSGDAIVAPHRARHERGVGYAEYYNDGPRRGPLIPCSHARISRIIRPLRGRGRTEFTPPHTIARASLDVGLQLLRRFAAWILPRTYSAPWVGWAVSRGYAHLWRAHPGYSHPTATRSFTPPTGRMGIAARIQPRLVRGLGT